MIFGVGIDIVDVPRIRAAMTRFGDRFRARIFTPGEIAFCETRPEKYQSYAARFAAKEAFSKALGTGLRGIIAWRDIQIDDNEHSRPTVSVTGRAARLLGQRRVHISLSHTRAQAVAIALIEEP